MYNVKRQDEMKKRIKGAYRKGEYTLSIVWYSYDVSSDYYIVHYEYTVKADTLRKCIEKAKEAKYNVYNFSYT